MQDANVSTSNVDEFSLTAVTEAFTVITHIVLRNDNQPSISANLLSCVLSML